MPEISTTPQIAILFVCLGNICRSPLAEGLFREVVSGAGAMDRFVIDSAATGSWHVGNTPDQRSITTAQKHGVDISTQRCRQLCARDFDNFDHIVCMDQSNLATVQALQPLNTRANVVLFMAYALDQNVGIPDPYLEGSEGFEIACRMIGSASHALLLRLTR